MGKVFGIDMGTSNTLLYVKGKGIRIREPSVVAVDQRESRILAVGDMAKMMLGKTPGDKRACRPIRGGVVADFDIAAGMLEYFFRKEAGGAMILSRPRAIVSVPFGATSTEKLSFYQVASRAGAKSVGFVPELLAAALGCGMRIEEPKGKMIVNIGGGATEAAVLSFGGVVLANSVRVGGETFDNAISNFLRRKYGVAIGDVTAEQLKIQVGSVLPGGEERSLEVRGRNMRSCGRPISITVMTSEIMDTLRGPASQIIECIRTTFERTPPELCADIYESGLVLTGGVSMLRGLGELIEKRTGIRTLTVKKPLDSVAAGLGVIIEKDDPYGVIENIDR